MAIRIIEGNPINRRFNKIADGCRDIVQERLVTYGRLPSGSLSEIVNYEASAYAIMFMLPVLKTVQALASLSASITGGRQKFS